MITKHNINLRIKELIELIKTTKNKHHLEQMESDLISLLTIKHLIEYKEPK